MWELPLRFVGRSLDAVTALFHRGSFTCHSLETLVSYGPCREDTCLSVDKLFEMVFLLQVITQVTLGKWFYFFLSSGMSDQSWSASYISSPGPLTGAGYGAN